MEKKLESFSRKRTAYVHSSKMLIRTLGVIASTTNGLKLTQGVVRIYLMTISHREESTGDILRESGVVTVRFEHPKGTFIRYETRRFDQFIRRRGLYMS